MKENPAIAISVISFGLIYLGMEAVTHLLGLPTYIDFGESVTVTRGSGRYSYDEDIEGEYSDIGWFILICSAMLSWRVYHWAISGKIDGGISKEAHTTWFFWLIGIATYIFTTTIIWQIDMPETLQRLLVFGCAGGIAWLAYNKHAEAIEKIRKTDDDEE